MPDIIQAETPEQMDEARRIFTEYENWLGVSLCFQGFDEEMAGLPGKYAPPEGRLLFAIENDQVAGCVASRRLDNETCEMKRLFVRPEFQGLGLGSSLIDNLITEARASGYKKMRLDSWIPRMGKAIEMYRRHGFYEIEPYNENPYEMIFMERVL
jgi:ribosomal protein S18 acetylase RimI-like enzyme